MAIKIMLDPGHGRDRRGFVNVPGFPYCTEGECNFYYAKNFLKPELEKHGFVVSMTKGSMGENPSLAKRGRMAKGYDLLLSLHSNAANGQATGVEIWDSTNPREKLPQLYKNITANIADAIGTKDRGVHYRAARNGSNYYGILRNGLAKHNAIIEHVFHDNYSDAKKYVNNLDKIARVTASAIASFYGKETLCNQNTGVVNKVISNPIMSKGTLSKEQIKAYLLNRNPNPLINTDVDTFIDLFIREAGIEGVNHDIAFAQAIKETGFFKYGGDVLPEQNNYAGIGTTGGGVTGHYFPTPQIGIQAQIQHLKAYASDLPLLQKCVDPRFHLVKRGVAPDVVDLNGRWAVPGKGYGEDILRHIAEMKKIEVKKEETMNEEKREAIPDWAREDFVKAIKLGITDGTRPGDPATRLEAAVMIVRALNLK